MSDSKQGSGFGSRESGRGTTGPDLELDAIIDAVAREMVSAEAPAGLRTQVLERLERDGRRVSPAAALRWAWAPALALVLAVAAGTWFYTRDVPIRRDDRSRPASVAIARSTEAAGPTAAAGTPAAGAGTMEAAPRGSGQAGRRVRGRRASATFSGASADEFPVVPALADIEPLTFPGIEPVHLNIPGVDVTPLDVIPPLEIPDLVLDATDSRSRDPKKEQ